MTRLIPCIALFGSLLLAGCTGLSQPTSPYGPRAFTGPGYTALVVAYAPELQGMLETIESMPDASIAETVVYRGIAYRIGEYRGRPIILFETGMSIANAAMSMQMAIDYFPINEVVYMGIAGAVNPDLKPGDVIVPERWYYHDESVYANPSPEDPQSYILPDYYRSFLDEQPSRRDKDPHTPRYKNFGMIHPDEVLIVKDGMDRAQDISYFSASLRLLDAARAARLSFDSRPFVDGREVALQVGGNGVTGSVFVDNRDYRLWLREVFDAEVTEMESAAIGQVCTVNDIDWVIIRAISDLAGGQEGKNEENIYDLDASLVGAAFLFEVMNQLTAD